MVGKEALKGQTVGDPVGINSNLIAVERGEMLNYFITLLFDVRANRVVKVELRENLAVLYVHDKSVDCGVLLNY